MNPTFTNGAQASPASSAARGQEHERQPAHALYYDTRSEWHALCRLSTSHSYFLPRGNMKSFSASLLLLAMLSGLASAQSTTSTGGNNEQHGAPPASGASGETGTRGVGSASSAIPDSTGGSHTPGTSASGQKADCPAAIARSQSRDRGSSGTGSGYQIFGPSTAAANADCASVGSGAASGDSGTSGTRDAAPSAPISPGTGSESGGGSNPRSNPESGPTNGIGR